MAGGNSGTANIAATLCGLFAARMVDGPLETMVCDAAGALCAGCAAGVVDDVRDCVKLATLAGSSGSACALASVDSEDRNPGTPAGSVDACAAIGGAALVSVAAVCCGALCADTVCGGASYNAVVFMVSCASDCA